MNVYRSTGRGRVCIWWKKKGEERKKGRSVRRMRMS